LSDNDAITVAVGAVLDDFGTITEGTGGTLDNLGSLIVEEKGFLDIFGTVHIESGASYNPLGLVTVESGGILELATTTEIASSVPSGLVYGNTVTFTATVLSGGGATLTPAGALQFQIDGHNFGNPVSLAEGSALIKVSSLSAGSHTVSANYIGDSEFLMSSGTLAGDELVTPAPLTISADNKSIALGSSLPTLTATYQGFVNGDTPASLTAPPKLVTMATSMSPAGSYPISVSGGSNPNYTIRYIPGTLTITASTQQGNAETAYVTLLYRTVLGRAVDANGLASWLGRIQAGASYLQVAQGFWESPEHRGIQVDGFYSQYLHREADAAGRSYWTNLLLTGAPETSVILSFLTSPEYGASRPTAISFVSSLYTDLLGRAIDSAGLAQWVPAVQLPSGRILVAADILFSTESIQRTIDSFYSSLLQRSSDPTGEGVWVDYLQSNPGAESAIAEAFLSSPEFLKLT
jgi:hypothetical protein